MPVEAILAATTWYLVGLVWLVQVVQYPMFQFLDRATFTHSHAFHSGAIGFVVAPPMLLELGLVCWLAWNSPSSRNWAGLALVVIIWATTFLFIVPIHNQLGARGFSADLHAKLLAWNWVRTASWTLRGILLLIHQTP